MRTDDAEKQVVLLKKRAAQKRPRPWAKKMRAAREKMRPPFFHAEAARGNFPVGFFIMGSTGGDEYWGSTILKNNKSDPAPATFSVTLGATKLNSGATKLNSGAAKLNSAPAVVTY